ncbi:MAG: hypothetical protein JWN15_1563 [Firmicutes bacterium]|nr:hypothetical protein [Bacillota bacterium]
MITPSEINPNRVAVYIRWSTDDQGEGTTLETQRERCKFYLQSQGWTFREDLEYIDDGCSGGTLDRPALTQLRTHVTEGKIECVVVYKIDRLSRSVVDIVDLVLREWDSRCFIKSTTEDVNTITPAGKMFFYILVSFAEYERNLIKERTMGGKIKRAEQGRNPGFRPPYGYIKGRDTGTVEVVDHESSVVRRIFDLYVAGNGGHQIAHMLNTEGTTRRNAGWNGLMVRRLLMNPAYIGVLEYGKTMRVGKEQRERRGLGRLVRFQQPRFARVEGAFPAIVNRRTWDSAQQLLNARTTSRNVRATKPTYSDYLLSGLATCKCGAGVNGKGAGRHQYYYCSVRKRLGSAACDAGHVSADAVHAVIESKVKRLLSAEGRQLLLSGLEQDLADRIHAIKNEIAHGQMALVGLGDRRRRLEADYRSGELPAKLYAREIEATDLDYQSGQRRLASLQLQRSTTEHAKENKTELTAGLDRIDLWQELNVPERKRLLGKLLAGIRLYRRAHTQDAPTLELDWIQLV